LELGHRLPGWELGARGVEVAGLADFDAGHGAAHPGEGPAGLEEAGAVGGAGVAEEEPALGELLGDGAELGGGEAVVASAQAFHDALAIGVGLKASDCPEAGIAEGAVIEVHGVLGRDDDSDAERSGLLQERDEGALGGRVGRMRREEAVDFVEDDQRAQAGGAR